MSRYRRISKEEYYLFGRIIVWTLDDAMSLIASCELEYSGAYGESLELMGLNSNNMFFFGESNEIELKYKNVYNKWHNLLLKSLFKGEIKSCNVPCCNDDPEYAPVGDGKQIDLTYCSFKRDDLLKYINNLIKIGESDFNLRKFIDYLNGESSAPHKYVKNVEIEKIVEVVKTEYREMTKEEAAKLLSSAKNRNAKDTVISYVTDMLSKECTCYHTIMTEMVIDYFKNTDNDPATNEKDRVSKLTPKVVRDTVKAVYKDKNMENLIFDLKAHGGKKNKCDLHNSSK